MVLQKAPSALRKAIPERHMSRVMRWVLIFCIGFYFGQIIDKAPEKIEAAQNK